MVEFLSLRTEREADAEAPSPFAGAKKAGTKSLAKAQTKKKAEPPEDEEPPADEPEAPPEEPTDEPGDEPADAPADDPTEEPAEKDPEAKPQEEPPEEPEEPSKEEPIPIWQIPMDTILGRTAMDDLERYLKTIAATLQNAGLDLDRAAGVVDATVAQMTQAKLLPPLPAEPSDDEISTWMNAALSVNLASVIVDRA